MSDDMCDGWSGETRWRSNDGRGPLEMRCVDERGDVFTFRRWNTKTKRMRETQFRLTKRALAISGWVRVTP